MTRLHKRAARSGKAACKSEACCDAARAQGDGWWLSAHVSRAVIAVVADVTQTIQGRGLPPYDSLWECRKLPVQPHPKSEDKRSPNRLTLTTRTRQTNTSERARFNVRTRSLACVSGRVQARTPRTQRSNDWSVKGIDRNRRCPCSAPEAAGFCSTPCSELV